MRIIDKGNNFYWQEQRKDLVLINSIQQFQDKYHIKVQQLETIEDKVKCFWKCECLNQENVIIVSVHDTLFIL